MEVKKDKKCVFCDKSQFEERLAGETNDFWIIATLGQITDGGYLLLVPKQHVECVGAMNPNETILLEKLLAKTQKFLRKEYGTYGMVFEHGIVGQTVKHAHIHIVPPNTFRTINLAGKISRDFSSPQYDFSAVPSLTNLQMAYAKSPQPYLLWQNVGDCGFMICWNPPAPPLYLRIVVAEALGRPERANWRTMDPELDKKLWSETVHRMQPYFSNLSET